MIELETCTRLARFASTSQEHYIYRLDLSKGKEKTGTPIFHKQKKWREVKQTEPVGVSKATLIFVKVFFFSFFALAFCFQRENTLGNMPRIVRARDSLIWIRNVAGPTEQPRG